MTKGKRQASFRVNSQMCDTCIFGKNSPISSERFAELERQWEREGIVQQCHASTIQGGDVGCRGHYEKAKADKSFPHPLDRVREQLGMSEIERERFMRFCEQIGWVTFVKVEKS